MVEKTGVELSSFSPVQDDYSFPKGDPMADNKDQSEKQPGENPEGTYHFNPGNMAGKKPKDEEQTAENRDEPNKHKGKGGG
jgi:hypothetical protein